MAKRPESIGGLNGDTARRDDLLASTEASCDEYGGIRPFIGMEAGTLAALIAEGFLEADSRQNDSPTAAEFLAYMEANEGVTAIGYAVSPERSDYRVTIEGIVLAKPYTAEQEASFRSFCERADELFETDSPYGRGLRAWWD